ncbi:hypothetical protein G6F65_015650 [Rhizopus arrhizus]|nr:hypothetical protein G6F65_015650 [Rhizopus arrhizus]
MSGQDFGKVFVNQQGVMIGDGQVWLTGECLDKACARTEVKVGTIHGRHYRASGLRGELQQACLAAVFQQPKRAIRALFHFADALAHVEALGFARAVAVEGHAHQRGGGQAADEAAALPLREQGAAVDHEAGRGDHRRPGHLRRGEFRTGIVVGNRTAIVVVAIGDDRVAVVGTAHDQVQFVTTGRAHLVCPQLAVGIEGHAEDVAVAQRPYLCGDASLRGERIVGGQAAIIVEADDLAEVAAHVLRRIEFLPLAGADPQLAVRAEGEAVAVVAFAADLGALPPDHLQVLQLAGAAGVQRQRGAGDGGTAGIQRAFLGVAEVDHVVAGELRMQDHVAETALAAIGDLGHAAFRASR